MFLQDAQFALWVDFIEREFISTKMKALIEAGTINGATSNPAIFKSAFLTSSAYKEEIAKLKGTMTPKAMYETMAVKDITLAADVLRPLYDRGDDGFVSIEVDPSLAYDAQGTIEEGKRLYMSINRPNVMIKIPATQAGYLAMETLTSEGINVNATLIFSLQEALSCAHAFAAGHAKSKTKAHSVISVFVSRLDRALDAKLPHDMQAKAGILNAAHIYSAIEDMHIPNTRVLFASTGVKGDRLHPAYYISGLLAPHSVNTAPLETIDAFVKEGAKTVVLPVPITEITTFFKALHAQGIDLDATLEQLKKEGLEAFEVAFAEILTSLE